MPIGEVKKSVRFNPVLEEKLIESKEEMKELEAETEALRTPLSDFFSDFAAAEMMMLINTYQNTTGMPLTPSIDSAMDCYVYGLKMIALSRSIEDDGESLTVARNGLGYLERATHLGSSISAEVHRTVCQVLYERGKVSDPA
ncbi:MAG: hypothetical protein GWP59_02300 [Chlamydiales bacterium]|nr:hypothetical protein [Chlamydiales bacterium]NCF70512.1 hypothetical protein [Chlamydiales bacterium]